MLDISFYTQDGIPAQHLELADTLLEWLAHSDFSTIGQDTPTSVLIDGEPDTLPLVPLTPTNRQHFINFFHHNIIEETKITLTHLEQAPPPEATLYRLKKLIELLDCLKTDQYAYLQRY
jgi:hypothetical protein